MFYDYSRLMCHFLLAGREKLSDRGSILKWNIQELPEWIIICASLRHKKATVCLSYRWTMQIQTIEAVAADT